MRRLASLGLAMLLGLSSLVPAAHAQEGKTIVLGFSQEPDTFIAWEGGLYVTQVAANLIYSPLVSYDDVMQPFPDLAVRVPTLVVWGNRDFIPREISEHLVEALPQSRLVTLEDCGHFAYLECPDAVRATLQDFVRDP